MTIQNYTTKTGNWQTVTKHDPCPICGKPDWCSRTADGKVVACRRVNNGEGIHKVDKNGDDYWLYIENGEGFKNPEETFLPVYPEPQRADPDTLHRVYKEIISELTLSPVHKENLIKRGFSDAEILHREYRTLPERGRSRIAKKILQKFGSDICSKVPGLFVKKGDKGNYWTLAGAAGLLIPVRNRQGRIIALKIRKDDPGDGPKYLYVTSVGRDSATADGPGPGNPVHFPLPPISGEEIKSGLVRITEGELKADIATALSGVFTISLPGVSSWQRALTPLREMKVETVLLAFDADAAKNTNVARAQRLAAEAMKNEGYTVKIETWSDEYKGIDDALAAGAEIKTLEATEAWEKIEADEYSAAKAAAEKALQKLKEDPLGRHPNLYPTIAALDPALRDVYRKRIKEILKPYGVQAKTVDNLLDDAVKKTEEAKAAAASPVSPDCPYFINKNQIYVKQMTKDGPVSAPLGNFAAKIEEEQIRDDGAEITVDFVVSGVLSTGEPLPKAVIPASKYASMNWPTECWGTRPVVYAGQGKKDHLRAAIQLLSGSENVKRKTVFTHTGWRNLDGQFIFLHAGGAIGADGPVEEIYVDQHIGLDQVLLSPPPRENELIQGINTALFFLQLAPGRITFPLFGGIFRAPLAEACAIDYSLYTTGGTGTQKTSVAAVAQAFYGANFTASNLPANWSSTANALERIAFLAKDILLVVDDFCPQGTSVDVARLHKEADRLLRGAGNQAGRSRMRPDGSLRPTYYPRGLLLSTGEDVPRVQSLRARMFILEFEPGDVDLGKLTKLQDAAQQGVLSQVMASYISYLARHMGELKRELPARQRQIRTKAREKGIHINTHDRTPDIYASLYLGFYCFLVFAYESKAITQGQLQEMLDQADQYLTEAARRQAELLAGEDPALRFIQLIIAAITSGQAYIADATTGTEPFDAENWGWRDGEPRGILIGWNSGELIYLQPDSAFMVAQRMASTQGAALAIGQKTLWKRMQEQGYIAEADPGRNTIKKVIVGERKRVICITSYILQETGLSGQSGQPLHEPQEYGVPY